MSKRFDHFMALDRLNLKVANGQIFGYWRFPQNSSASPKATQTAPPARYNKAPHAANFHGGATDAAGCAGAEGGVDSGGRGAVTAILRVLMCHVTAAWACCDNPQP